MCHYFKE